MHCTTGCFSYCEVSYTQIIRISYLVITNRNSILELMPICKFKTLKLLQFFHPFVGTANFLSKEFIWKLILDSLDTSKNVSQLILQVVFLRLLLKFWRYVQILANYDCHSRLLCLREAGDSYRIYVGTLEPSDANLKKDGL